MFRKIYRFDHNSLDYKQEKPCLRQRFKSILVFLVSSMSIAMVILLAILLNGESPKMQGLEKRNKELISQIKNLDDKFTQRETLLAKISNRDDNYYRVISEAPPIPKSVRESGFGGSENYAKYESFEEADLMISTAKRLDKISKQAYIQSKSYEEVLELVKEKEKKFETLPAICPISKESLSYVSDYFGWRMHPVYKRKIFHWGVDLSANIGTPVYAPGDGVVEKLNYASSGFGRLLTIDHGYGLKTLYGHLSRFNVTKGQKIKRGDIIAFVGNAGVTSGPHLHYGVVKNGKKIDPSNFYTLNMPPEEYMQIISMKDSE